MQINVQNNCTIHKSKQRKRENNEKELPIYINEATSLREKKFFVILFGMVTLLKT